MKNKALRLLAVTAGLLCLLTGCADGGSTAPKTDSSAEGNSAAENSAEGTTTAATEDTASQKPENLRYYDDLAAAYEQYGLYGSGLLEVHDLGDVYRRGTNTFSLNGSGTFYRQGKLYYLCLRVSDEADLTFDHDSLMCYDIASGTTTERVLASGSTTISSTNSASVCNGKLHLEMFEKNGDTKQTYNVVLDLDDESYCVKWPLAEDETERLTTTILPSGDILVPDGINGFRYTSHETGEESVIPNPTYGYTNGNKEMFPTRYYLLSWGKKLYFSAIRKDITPNQYFILCYDLDTKEWTSKQEEVQVKGVYAIGPYMFAYTKDRQMLYNMETFERIGEIHTALPYLGGDKHIELSKQKDWVRYIPYELDGDEVKDGIEGYKVGLSKVEKLGALASVNGKMLMWTDDDGAYLRTAGTEEKTVFIDLNKYRGAAS